MSDASAGPRIRYNQHVIAHPKTRVYVTGTPERNRQLDQREPPYMSDAAYGEMLDAVVPACVDVLIFMPDGRLLLGRRQHEPQPDWWVFGGRMRARETFVQAATCLLEVELGFTLDPARLGTRPVGAFSLVWDSREQDPAENGCHTLSLPFIYEMSWGEYETLRPNQEYAELLIIDPTPVSLSERYHPALRDMVAAAMEARMIAAAMGVIVR